VASRCGAWIIGAIVIDAFAGNAEIAAVAAADVATGPNFLQNFHILAHILR